MSRNRITLKDNTLKELENLKMGQIGSFDDIVQFLLEKNNECKRLVATINFLHTHSDLKN